MAFETINYKPYKRFVKSFTNLSNKDGTKYYISISDIKSALGATEIYSATIAGWSGGIANNNSFNICYNTTEDKLYIMFSPHTFSNAALDVLFFYE